MQREKVRRRHCKVKPVVAFDHTDQWVKTYLKSLDTPIANEVSRMYSNDQVSLMGISIDPRSYSDPLLFRRDLAAVSLLSKSQFLRLGINKERVAIEKFLACEKLCDETNRRLRSNPTGSDAKNMHLMFRMRFYIGKILGSFNVETWLDEARWGPGASTLIKRRLADYPTKFLDERGITTQLATVAHECKLFEAYPGWAVQLSRLITQTGNRVVTVPKNAKTNRPIAIEPGFNIWFQLGIGTMIRRALRKFGINLDSQTRNQLLARLGSISGLLATVDFSSASDTIARELVRILFDTPMLRKWLYAMEACRSHCGTLDGRTFHWKKFSSMGNGFTFELETLIFYAAALAVCEDLEVPSNEVSVFGDDVVIPTQCVSSYEKLTAYLGFQFNKEKSFWTGNFRESCGEYYFSGVDCKPIFLKERINNGSQVYKTANSVRDQAHRWGDSLFCDARFKTGWQFLFEALEPHKRYCGSLGTVTDNGFAVNCDEALFHTEQGLRPHCDKDGLQGLWAKLLVTVPVSSKAPYDHAGVLHTALRYTATDATFTSMKRFGLKTQQNCDLSNRATLWHRILGVRKVESRVLIPSWYDLGPWDTFQGC